MRWPRVLSAGLLALAACGGCEPDREHIEVLFSLDANRLPGAAAPRAQAALGEWLFDHGLGGAGCAECHCRSDLGQDGRSHQRNTPALVDVARQTLFGWGGTTGDLTAMVQRELAVRLGVDDDDGVRAAAAADGELARRFEAAFPGEQPTLDHVARALAAELATWRSRGRWDRYVDGDDSALTAAEREGVAIFIEVGCAACHGGRNLGGGTAHLLGLAEPFETADPGRALGTGDPQDRGIFKAPMLRHAAVTAPYLHDGSIAKLEDVVRLMGRHELGVELLGDQVRAIVALLHATADSDRP